MPRRMNVALEVRAPSDSRQLAEGVADRYSVEAGVMCVVTLNGRYARSGELRAETAEALTEAISNVVDYEPSWAWVTDFGGEGQLSDVADWWAQTTAWLRGELSGALSRAVDALAKHRDQIKRYGGDL
jgi:hypothetical protein